VAFKHSEYRSSNFSLYVDVSLYSDSRLDISKAKDSATDSFEDDFISTCSVIIFPILLMYNAKFSGRWQIYDELSKHTEL
jgi:hypothetical protein